MSGKDDPLQQTKTLWLDRDAMQIARERYYYAALTNLWLSDTPDRRESWNLCWAAAVAVHSFISEGRLGPPVDDSEPAS